MKNIESKIEYPKIIARFLELLVWFLVFVSIVTAVVLYNSYSHKHFNRYQIFFQDVDGIIVGSPVRMLGIQVGYVKHIKFVNDMVYVDFIINQKDIEIPKGSKITVEFSGLGGSKSLEIYPPTYEISDLSAPLYIQQPRRLGAALSLLNAMFEKIGQITYKCTSFANKLDTKSINKNSFSGNEEEFLTTTDKWLDKRLEKNRKRGMNNE